MQTVSHWLLSSRVRLLVPVLFLISLLVKHFLINPTASSFVSLLKCQIGIYYFWCGLIVLEFAHAWLKFQIPTLNYPVLFDVGRHFFSLAGVLDGMLSLHLLFNWVLMFFVVCDPAVASRLFVDYQTAPRSYVVCQTLIRPASASYSPLQSSYQALMGAVQTLLMPFSTTATTALTTGSAASTWLAALHEAANRLLIGLDHFGGAYLHLVPLIAVGVEWIAVYPRLLRRADAIVSTKQYPLPANYGSRFWAISIHILAILTAAVKMRFAFVAGNAVLTTLLSLPQ